MKRDGAGSVYIARIGRKSPSNVAVPEPESVGALGFVMATGELAVEYRMTPLGHTLDEPVGALLSWSWRHEREVRDAQRAYLEKVEAAEDGWGSPTARAVPIRIAAG